ncbi:hypothetical protein AB0F68_34915 [Micromonospora sp. NPDC023966]
MTISEDLPEMRRRAIRIAGGYMGPDLAEAYGARTWSPLEG